MAAERAAHWCSLAALLQHSALLPNGPASPDGSAAASLSATPASGRTAGTPASSAPTSVLSSSSAPRSLGRARGPDAARSAARLLAEWRPASAVRQPSRAAAGSDAALAGGGGSPQGPGLLKAFQAVAEEQAPPSPDALVNAAVEPASAAGPDMADAHAAKLRFKLLDASSPSSAGQGPLTPLPHMALAGTGECQVDGDCCWCGFAAATASCAPACLTKMPFLLPRCSGGHPGINGKRWQQPERQQGRSSQAQEPWSARPAGLRCRACGGAHQVTAPQLAAQLPA